MEEESQLKELVRRWWYVKIPGLLVLFQKALGSRNIIAVDSGIEFREDLDKSKETSERFPLDTNKDLQAT